MKNLLLFIVLIILLVGCLDKKGKIKIDPSHIKLDSDIYLKPLGKNEKGCSIFSPYSVSGEMVASVIYFLDQNSKPTMESNPKDCK